MPTRTRVACAVVLLASLAGCRAGEPADAGAEQAIAEADVAVTGSAELLWEPEVLTADAGEITFALTCEGANHDLVIEETDVEVAECVPGETVVGTTELDAGTYTFVCTVPGHEDRMRGTLEVR